METKDLYHYAALLEERMRKLPGFIDVATDMQLKKPQVNVLIDRDRASAVGITATQIESALFSAYGARQISTIFTPNNQYQVIVEVDAEARKIGMPATITHAFQGAAQAFESSIAGMGWLLLFAVLVIYMVLGILYESFIHPVTILTALPFAGFGALVTLLGFHVDLSLYAFVGIIMLVGLVKKNGIMMVDFAVVARKEGKSPEEAIYHACMVRFRPIMMTTVAALMAGIPIAVGWGAGAESRRSLGLAVVGGILFSQLLTLYVTPVFYVYFERLQSWLRRKQPA